MSDAGHALAAYLNDHRGGAMAGTELAKGLRDKHEGTPQATVFAELATEIDEDLATLEDLMARLGVEKNPVKAAAGWMLERLSRFARSDVVTRSPELTTLLEMETLSLGVEGKLALWKSLKTVADRYPELAKTDLDGLAARASSQLDRLERERLRGAGEALRA